MGGQAVTSACMSDPAQITVSGAPEGFDASLILKELEKASVVVHVARDDKRMAAMAEALEFFAPHVPVLKFPGWDCLPYDRVSPGADTAARRLDAFAGLLALRDDPPQLGLSLCGRLLRNFIQFQYSLHKRTQLLELQ